MFKDKTLLITGGTGSFGNAVLERFLNTDVKEIRVFSRDEKKQDEMRILFNNPKIKFYIGDVRNYDSIHTALKDVDFVFHAAALKQVPSCEFYPTEAFNTNVIGSENLMKAAINQFVEKVVMLSTDKAVYPINAMGLSKAMMEKCMIARSRSQNKDETIFCATRYGNVTASRGSVVPLFLSQIKNNVALTVTDPNMTRFLMSLEDSVNLVLFAFQNAEQGDIFVQKAPAAKIETIALAINFIFKKNNNIRTIGTRHGEKLFETLISREEMARVEDMGNYYRIPSDSRDLNYAQFYSEGQESVSLSNDYTSHNSNQLNLEEVKEILLALDCVKKEIHG